MIGLVGCLFRLQVAKKVCIDEMDSDIVCWRTVWKLSSNNKIFMVLNVKGKGLNEFN